MAVPITTAILALNRREPQRALQVLEPVTPYDHAPSFGAWSRYLRGQAYLELGDGPAAAAQFQSILDHRGEAPVSMFYALAHGGLARAAALAGNVEATRSYYERLFDLWRDADATAQPLKEARLQYARLSVQGRPDVSRASGR